MDLTNWSGWAAGAGCTIAGALAFAVPQWRALRKWKRRKGDAGLRIMQGLLLAGIDAQTAGRLITEYYTDNLNRLTEHGDVGGGVDAIRKAVPRPDAD